VLPNEALAAARAAEAEITDGHYRGPLHGIPFGLKDIYDTASVATEGGSKLCLGRVPAADATTARLLKQAGAILLGKLTTWELAIGGTAFDTPFPPARNPWNPEHDPAVVERLGCRGRRRPVRDGDGQRHRWAIRWPAAWCGLAGLKPTYGRVGRAGIMPLSFSLDHAGPLIWTVEDAAMVLRAIAGHDPLDPASADRAVPDYRAALASTDVKGVRLGIPRAMFECDCPAFGAMGTAFEAAVEVLRARRRHWRGRAAAAGALQRHGVSDHPQRRLRDPRKDVARAAARLRCHGSRPADDRRLCPRLRHGAGHAAAADPGRGDEGGNCRV
jgi:aspartyl-tRNA(Asn)/glutamyl-tRNA(Gln) amidotransferase subunit A